MLLHRFWLGTGKSFRLVASLLNSKSFRLAASLLNSKSFRLAASLLNSKSFRLAASLLNSKSFRLAASLLNSKSFRLAASLLNSKSFRLAASLLNSKSFRLAASHFSLLVQRKVTKRKHTPPSRPLRGSAPLTGFSDGACLLRSQVRGSRLAAPARPPGRSSASPFPGEPCPGRKRRTSLCAAPLRGVLPASSAAAEGTRWIKSETTAKTTATAKATATATATATAIAALALAPLSVVLCPWLFGGSPVCLRLQGARVSQLVLAVPS
ncbi:hypothetical protein [Xanthomonas rydalmerensis]|uniref:Uncharacterized protein n=1 Tax=Xanthomonas rydalmerensis TaxID=3046274 RepID=A0ABZ0JJ26_9XANT|nr:hypothetical protein [Xanthomonas sp. DM-2023]WOS38969.1 hypothetical protein QN243_10900 [Xanthomonas sp. DM-2023]WOS43151.1 hypothetical protein QN242_10900 [Xanthomonas sp. DM-2023]WOS47331.1 hypothetical protein QN240_10900 [Xanthomonas sp. DM-2023]WOS51512.1 hypothetical protein QN244_10900 [Xanthomonas sp. DM-2023]WOS55694.1 hypothetical protein QN245_10900 [Xanthomonas sp. DM-2023]